MRHLPSVAFLLSLRLAGAFAGAEMDEYRVKALFLYNFTQFVEWPTDAFKGPAEPLNICVVSPSPFESGGLERAIKGKQIDSHPLVTRLIPNSSQTAGCHIVFLGAPSAHKGKLAMPDPNQPGLLSVGEVSGFGNAGGVINFLVRDGRVRLEINPAAAERARLRVSAKLLKLAEIVK